MELSEAINNSCTSDLKLFNLANLIEDAQPRITFWGSRCVFIPEYEGYVYLSACARKILDNAENSSSDWKDPDLMRAVADMRELYRKTDTMLWGASFLTRILNCFQQLFNLPGDKMVLRWTLLRAMKLEENLYEPLKRT